MSETTCPNGCHVFIEGLWFRYFKGARVHGSDKTYCHESHAELTVKEGKPRVQRMVPVAQAVDLEGPDGLRSAMAALKDLDLGEPLYPGMEWAVEAFDKLLAALEEGVQDCPGPIGEHCILGVYPAHYEANGCSMCHGSGSVIVLPLAVATEKEADSCPG